MDPASSITLIMSNCPKENPWALWEFPSLTSSKIWDSSMSMERSNLVLWLKIRQSRFFHKGGRWWSGKSSMPRTKKCRLLVQERTSKWESKILTKIRSAEVTWSVITSTTVRSQRSSRPTLPSLNSPMRRNFFLQDMNALFICMPLLLRLKSAMFKAGLINKPISWSRPPSSKLEKRVSVKSRYKVYKFRFKDLSVLRNMTLCLLWVDSPSETKESKFIVI